MVAGLVLPGLAGCAQPASGETGRDAGDPAAEAVEAGCMEVSGDLLGQIAVGTEAGVTFDPTEGAAVQAREGVYVVAVRFQGDRDDPEVGVWTVAALEGPAAPLLVADEVSSTYSSWSTVEEFPQFGVELDSPLIAAARDCLDE